MLIDWYGEKEMLRLIKKYSIEIAVLVVCCVYFSIMAAPDLSWVNVDSDGPTYLTSAKYFVLSHPTGAPLYSLINAAVVRIPIGTEYWRLCMVSALSAGATGMLLYILGRRYTESKWKALIAPLVWCGSAVVVSQATILDTYAVITFLSVLAYYLHVTGRFRSKYIVLGIGLGIHHLILIPLAVIWLVDITRNIQARKRGEKVGFVRPAMFVWMLGLLFYIWVPLVNREPYNWIEGESFKHYISYFMGQGGLIGGLSVFEPDGMQRLYDFVGITALSFALSGLLIVPGLIKVFKGQGKNLEGMTCAYLMIFPIVYYATDMAPQVYTYMMPAFAFGGLMAVMGAESINRPALRKWVPLAVGVSSVVLMGCNLQWFDIGRTLDKDLQARVYYESLDELEDGSYLWLDHGGWWRDTIWLYNEDTGSDITILPVFGASAEWNLEAARAAYEDDNLMIQDFLDTQKCTSEFREVNEEDFERIAMFAGPRLEYQEGLVMAEWTNPVDTIQGKTEMERWSVVTDSSLDAGFIMLWAVWGIGCTYVADFFVKRNRAMDKRKRVMVRAVILGFGICVLILICSAAGMELAF